MMLLIMSTADSTEQSDDICNSYIESLDIALTTKANGGDMQFLETFYNQLVEDNTINAKTLSDRLLITEGVFNYIDLNDPTTIELYGLTMIQWCKAKYDDNPQTSLQFIPHDEALEIRGKIYRCPAGTNQYGTSNCLEA